MEPARPKLAARLALVAFAALCGAWLARLDYARKISTNALDLLPASEAAPEAVLVRSLAGGNQARVMLFALRDPARPDAAPGDAARQFAAELGRSPAFAEATAMDGDALAAAGRAIFERRFALLLPSWLGRREAEFAAAGLPAATYSSWLAERSAARLEAFLAQPQAVPMQDLVTSDPLLLMADFMGEVRELEPGEAPGGRALVWGRIKASPFAEDGQGPVFAAIGDAIVRARAGHPGLEVRWTGINRFAAASRARIQAELSVLNLLSILAVVGVGCALVRRIARMLHLVPVILLSLLGAWTVTTLVFDRVHILALVVGALLSGVAVDYGFYIYMQPALGPGEPYGKKLRRLLKPLLASCLTTVIGFSLLLFSELPMLREAGVFVAAGLLCALGVAMLYFAQLDRPFLEGRPWSRARAEAVLPRLRRPGLLLGLLAAAAVAGLWRLHWRDDVRELQIPSPELRANDEQVRAWFGERSDGRTYLTEGATAAEARRHLGEFLAFEAKAAPGVPAASLGVVFPTEADWQALPQRLARLGGFARQFRAALERHGFVADAFGGFFSSWESVRRHPPAGDSYEGIYSDLSRSLHGPFALLYHVGPDRSWFVTEAADGGPPPPPELHTLGVDQLESLNTLFVRYRWSALRLSLTGLALVIASVFAIYRGRRAVRIALIPAGSCLLVFGLFGWLGQTLNLFHLLGAFLGVCLSHNYAIFSSESAAAGKAPFVSVRLSGLCAAASFGVLGFSHIPVIHALGVTVAMIVLTALAVLEFESLAGVRRP